MLGSIVRWLGARAYGLLLLCLVSLLSLGGCSADVTPGEGTSLERSAVTGVTLKSIAVTPATPSLYVDAKQQLTATGTYSDGSTSDITQTVDWSSNNPVTASVSNQGLVTGVSKGSVTVSAQLGSVKGKVTVKVLLTLGSLAINPDKSKLPPSVTQPLSATGTYSNGTTKNLTSSVTWASSNPTIATVSAAGLVVTLAPGTTTITATLTGAAPGPVTDTALVTVSAATLTSLLVTPGSKQLPNGTSQQLTATGTFSDRTVYDLRAPAVTWSSSAPAVATVDANGLVTGVGAGTAVITGRHVASGIGDTAAITVTAAKLNAVTVTPVNPTLFAGITQAFAATGTFSDGTTLDLTAAVSWTSSATDIATVASDGTVVALTPGVSTITATDPKTKKAGSSLVTVSAAVIQTLAVTPDAPTTPSGTSLALTATATYTDGTVRDVTASVTWSSSDRSTADVSNATDSPGLVSAFAFGSVEIDVVDPTTGVEASTTFVVTRAALRSITVSPPSLALDFGRQAQLTAIATYADNSTADVTLAVNWISANPTVVRTQPNGVVVALKSGAAAITAVDPTTGLNGSSLVTVVHVPLHSITIFPPNPHVYVGQSVPFRALGIYADGSQQILTTSVTWSTDDSSVVISNADGSNGLATAVSVGFAHVIAFDPASGVRAGAVMTVDVLTCQPGFIACGFECKNAQADLQNCGACGNVCDTTCYAGGCALLVTNANDSGPGSLRDTVASVAPGGPVVFDPSLFGQTITVSSPIVVDHGVALLGPPGDTVTLSGGGASQILSITGGSVSLVGLTFEDGYTDGNGGAVDNCLSNRPLVVTACSFVNNHATGQYSFGGALCSATGQFFGDDFIGNSSSYYGGGLGMFGGRGNLFMQQLRFFGNAATFGGGMAVYDAPGQLQNGLFAQNYASASGGAAYVQSSPNFLLIQSDIVGNSSGIESVDNTVFLNSVAVTDNQGPALGAFSNGTFNVTYSDFWNNGGFQDTPDPGTTNGNLAAAPLFTDTSSSDALNWSLHLLPGSPLIDAGDPEVNDADGSRRDIGYYAGPIPPSH